MSKMLKHMITDENRKLVESKLQTIYTYCEYFATYETMFIKENGKQERTDAWHDMHNFAMFLNTTGKIENMTAEEILIVQNALLWMTSPSKIGHWIERIYHALLTLYNVAMGFDPYYAWNIGTTVEFLDLNKLDI